MPKQFSQRPTRAIRQSTEAIKGLEALVVEAQKGNKAARDKVLLAFLPWIEDQARLYAHRAARLDLIEDLRQTAICGEGKTLGGLMRALETFDPNRGSSFHTHAIYAINGAFQMMLASNVPGLTRRQYEVIERMRAIARDLRMAFGREPTLADIRRAATPCMNTRSDKSFNDALTTAEEMPSSPTLATNAHAYIVSVAEPCQENVVDARQELDRIAAIVSKQSPRNQLIFKMHVVEGLEQNYVAEVLGVSKFLVNRVLIRLMKKLAP